MPEDNFRLTRRAALAGAAVASATAALPAFATVPRRAFPRGFRWGASTAGHQIEGNNTNSDLWLMENLAATTFKERSGDACDSYHRWREDIALLKALGLNTYRMSIEWSRIEPLPGQFSMAELDHYKQVIADLHAAGIAPAITFFHASAPRWFAEASGWLNPASPDLFARYCDRACRALGDGMRYAFTINEPQVGLTYRTFPQAQAYFKAADEREANAHAEATRRTGVENFVTMNHPNIKGMTPQLLSAHAKGFAAIKAAQPGLPTGVTLNLVDFQPGNEDSKYRELRELAYGAWMDAVKRDGDFVGVQTYRQIQIPGTGAKLAPQQAMPFVNADEQNEMIKQPNALGNMVEYAHERTGKPVFVTENGVETDNDARRAWYIPQVLAGLQDVIGKGVPVLGYLHWSLLDNFEWMQGYGPKFGLASVDRSTFKRTLKPSSAVYSRIVRRNAI